MTQARTSNVNHLHGRKYTKWLFPSSDTYKIADFFSRIHQYKEFRS
jgi:hypothetical protein